MQESRAVLFAASPKCVLMLSFSRKEMNLFKENKVPNKYFGNFSVNNLQNYGTSMTMLVCSIYAMRQTCSG
jgi:hypothetical protein